MPDLVRFYTKREVARALGVAVSTMDRFVREGRICPVRVGSRSRFSQAVIDAFLAKCHAEALAESERLEHVRASACSSVK